MNALKYNLLLLLSAATALVACDKSSRSFSLLSDSNSFQQAPTVVTKKVDVLWVVDNSGSMDSSQQNLTNNFNAFIDKFQSLNYDFHMAVTTTDAYRGLFSSNPNFQDYARRYRRGPLYGSGTNFYYSPDSGVAIMTPTTSNLNQIFVTNALQGTIGSGDERAFSSFKDSLDPTFSANAPFRRSDAFLAIIIVSDEDDFSANTSTCVVCDYLDEVNSDPEVLPASSDPANIYNLYQDSRLTAVSSYKTFLDGLAGAGNYSINSINVMDNACKTQLNSSYSGRRIGRRYKQLTDLTKGVQTSLCADFGQSLGLISNSILELSSSFKLAREPIPSSIKVYVNSALVPQDAINGWTYDASTIAIIFHGSAVPATGSTVQVTFDPVAPKN